MLANSSERNSLHYEVWLNNILSVVKDIADAKKQEKLWPNPNFPWEQPNELVNSLFDDCQFETFVESNQPNFSAEQRASSNELLNEFQRFLASSPNNLDPSETLIDPRWEAIRSSAAKFAIAFADRLPESSS
jgi:hypothetical protein